MSLFWVGCFMSILVSFPALATGAETANRARARTLGIVVGSMDPGPWNGITDVPGVRVGHKTLIRGSDVRTGVTAVLPHGENLFLEKVPAAVVVGNGFGKLAGSTQIEELGNIEAPIVLTNTLSVGTAVGAVVGYVLGRPGNGDVHSVNAVVGETNDGYLNDIRGFHVTEADVIDAIAAAASGPVEEGSVGAGTGTIAFWFKGGIGTSSRVVGGTGDATYTVGVLVQSNFGGHLEINGAPIWKEMEPPPRTPVPPFPKTQRQGSCMIVVATDAPLSSRNLKRLARRALLGLARTGSHMSNGSGDYVIAFSTAYRIPYRPDALLPVPPMVANDAMSPLFQAVVEATEEAVYNSMFMATTVTGRKGRVIHAIPLDRVEEVCRRYGAISTGNK